MIFSIPIFSNITESTTLDVMRGDQALPQAITHSASGLLIVTYPINFSPRSLKKWMVAEGWISVIPNPRKSLRPLCGEEIDPAAGIIPIMWNIIPPAGGLGNIRYRFQLIQLEPPDRNPTDAFRSLPILFEQEDIMSTNFELLPDAMVTLEEGYTYAFRVTAYDPTGGVQFNNSGMSEVCTFRYGRAPASPANPQIVPEYPADGDIIPFSYFPLIIKYEPYSNEYHHFDSDLSIVSPSGALDSNHRPLTGLMVRLLISVTATVFMISHRNRHSI